MQRILAVLALAGVLALAACMQRQAPVTALSETVASYCLQSRAQHEGHRDACIIAPAQRVCASERLQQADDARAKAHAFCAKSPESTPANLATIKSLVAQQREAAR